MSACLFLIAAMNEQSHSEQWLPSALKALQRVADLKEDWNSEGGLPMRNGSMFAAYWTLSTINHWLGSVDCRLPVPAVVPMNCGNVQLEWADGEVGLELEFQGADTICFLQYDPQSGIENESVYNAIDFAKTWALICWFMDRAEEEKNGGK